MKSVEKEGTQLLNNHIQTQQSSQVSKQDAHKKQENGKSMSQIHIGRPASFNPPEVRTK